jgi:hypothetical protein
VNIDPEEIDELIASRAWELFMQRRDDNTKPLPIIVADLFHIATEYTKAESIERLKLDGYDPTTEKK